MPAQSAKGALKLTPTIATEGGEAASGRTDQRRKAASYLDMNLQREVGVRERQRHYVIETAHLNADRCNAVLIRHPIENRLYDPAESVSPHKAARDGQNARLQAVPPGGGTKRN